MQRVKKIIQYLFYLFVFLLPWQTRWIFSDRQINGVVWEYGRLSLYSFDIVFIAILFLSLFYFSKNRPAQILKPNNKKVFFLFGVLLIVFCVWFSSINKNLTIYWLIRLFQAVSLVFIANKININRMHTMLAFIFSMTLSVILGIYQFLSQSVFGCKWLGIAAQSAVTAGTSVIATTTGRFLRAYGNLPHPNILAGFILIAIIFIFYILIFEHKRLNNKFNLFLVSCLLFLGVGLFFTFSRAAWLGLILVLILFVIHNFKNKQNLKKLFFLFCVLLTVFCVLSLIFSPLVQTRLGATDYNRLEIKSNQQRLSGFDQSFDIIKDNSAFGIGFGAYTYNLIQQHPNLPVWTAQPVHNVYLLFLSEWGIFGLLLLIIFIFLNLKNIKQKSFLFCVLLIVFCFLFLFDHFWCTLPSAFLLVFVCVFCSVGNGRDCSIS